MEQRGERRTQVIMMYIPQALPQIFALVLAVSSVPAGTAFAQEDCGTVKECAEDMVALANELKAENAALLARITALEAALAQQARDNAAALESRIARLKAGSDQNPHPGGNGESGLCPNNTYMVGARWQVDGGGPHGIMSWFGPICRTMP